MSHATNLRNRQRPSAIEAPAKRRRISPAEPISKFNGITAVLNGSLSSLKCEATPTKNAKSHQESSRPDISSHVGGHEEESADVDMAEAASEDEVDAEHGHSSEEEDDEEENDSAEDTKLPNGHTSSSEQQLITQDDGESEETAEPSIGDMLRARGPETITVEASFPAETAADKSLASKTSNRALTIPSATSLGTVLTQALKTNDVDLLESCLQVPSLESIRATVQRLQSPLATILLQRLAERLHKRPGRAGSLMVWVQWTVVAHGGYLASQPAALKQLHTLYQVVKKRATGLQPLLALKGRLDMLEAQMQMRRNLQDRSRGGAAADEDDEGVIYVEGEEDEVDMPKKQLGSGENPGPDDIDEDDEDMPTTLANGIDSGDDEEVSASSDEDDDLIDDEAEETADDSGEDLSEEIDYDDVDQVAEDSESGEEERPAKRSTAAQIRRR